MSRPSLMVGKWVCLPPLRKSLRFQMLCAKSNTSNLCVLNTSSAIIGSCECLSDVMFGLTLTAHGQLGICLACAFQDGWPFRCRFVSAQDDLDVERIKLEASAASAGLFASDEGRSRTEEWVDDDVAAFGQVEQGVFQHGN